MTDTDATASSNTSGDRTRVPIHIAPATRDKLRALLMTAPFEGVGYTAFLELAMDRLAVSADAAPASEDGEEVRPLTERERELIAQRIRNHVAGHDTGLTQRAVLYLQGYEALAQRLTRNLTAARDQLHEFLARERSALARATTAEAHATQMRKAAEALPNWYFDPHDRVMRTCEAAGEYVRRADLHAVLHAEEPHGVHHHAQQEAALLDRHYQLTAPDGTPLTLTGRELLRSMAASATPEEGPHAP